MKRTINIEDINSVMELHTWTIHKENGRVICKSSSRAGGTGAKRVFSFTETVGEIVLVNSIDKAFAYYVSPQKRSVMQMFRADSLKQKSPNSDYKIKCYDYGDNRIKTHILTDGNISKINYDINVIEYPTTKHTYETYDVKITNATYVVLEEITSDWNPANTRRYRHLVVESLEGFIKPENVPRYIGTHLGDFILKTW